MKKNMLGTAFLGILLLTGVHAFAADNSCSKQMSEAQIIGHVRDSLDPVQTDPVKGSLCRFTISIREFSPAVFCGFNDQKRAESTILEKWDGNRGCPNPGDDVSGVLQLTPEDQLLLDGDYYLTPIAML